MTGADYCCRMLIAGVLLVLLISNTAHAQTTTTDEAPTTTTVPPSERNIVVKEYRRSMSCSGSFDVLEYDAGCRTMNPTESLLVFCADGDLHRLYFNDSKTCGTKPVSDDVFLPEQCYPDHQSIFPSSAMVSQCESPTRGGRGRL